jgi:hypothetical protein
LNIVEGIIEMRLFEFGQINEYTDRSPIKNQKDETTGLWLNEKGETWRSASPYLYAVKSPSGSGFIGQIHIPSQLWREHIQDKHQRWPEAPSSLFTDNLNNRMPIITPVYSDPRQAAWIAQEVLLDTGNHSAQDIIMGYLDWRYSGRRDENDAYLWFDLLTSVPDFQGPPLTGDDAEEFFADKDKLAQARAEREDAVKKQKTSAINANNFEADRKKKIKRELMNWFTKMGPAVAKKKFGKGKQFLLYWTGFSKAKRY